MSGPRKERHTMPDGWHMGWGLGWGVLTLTFWIVAVVGLALLIRWLTLGERRQAAGPTVRAYPTEGPPREDTALEILEKRYARGEIERTEYEEKRRDLTSR